MDAPSGLTAARTGAGERVRLRLQSVPAWLGSVAVLLCAGVLWWAASKRVFVIPDPLATVNTLLVDLGTPKYRTNIYATAEAVGASWSIAVAVGLALGLLFGLYAPIRDAIQPILVALNGVPKIVLYPVFILAFGLGLPSKIVMGALFGTFPLILILSGALRDTPPIYGRLGRSLQASRLQMVTKIYIPATMAPFLTGVRLAFSLSVVGVVLAELLASRAGLGRVIDQAYYLGQLREMAAAVLLLLVSAFAGALLLYALEKRAGG